PKPLAPPAITIPPAPTVMDWLPPAMTSTELPLPSPANRPRLLPALMVCAPFSATTDIAPLTVLVLSSTMSESADTVCVPEPFNRMVEWRAAAADIALQRGEVAEEPQRIDRGIEVRAQQVDAQRERRIGRVRTADFHNAGGKFLQFPRRDVEAAAAAVDVDRAE